MTLKAAFRYLSITVAGVMLSSPAITFAAPVEFSAAGKTPSDIQAAVDAFRNFLGANNGVGGTFPGGRREINWDGVPDASSAPNNLPANFFNANSPRGAVFLTPGLGFQVSGKAPAPIEFDNLKPNVSRKFTVFSAPRLFTALNSAIVETLFFVPGTAQSAITKGFGAVFTDVDREKSTKIEYFDASGSLLAIRFAPPAKGHETLSFIGVAFDAGEQVFLVRITSGNVELGKKLGGGPLLVQGLVQAQDAENSGGDLVVMDDFIYGEPTAPTASPTRTPSRK
jgi:hypothetical protein